MSDQLELFHMEAAERAPRAGGTKPKWGGSKSTAARAVVRRMLPAACWRCGKMITRDDPESSWHAGHVTDRAAGGVDDSSNYMPECAGCNTSAGGKVGAAITNAKRGAGKPPTMARERAPQWW